MTVTQSSDGPSTFGRILDSTEQTRVTPSPHPATTNENHIARAVLPKTKLNYIPYKTVTSDFEQRIHPVVGNYPNYHQEPQPPKQARTPTFRGNSNCQGIDNCMPSSHFSTSNMLSKSDSWKRLKHQQQKSQQRAFVRHSDNPFKSYKHDPNDTESYLDQLASSSNETTPTSASIIPPEGFLAIDTAQRHSHFFSRSAANGSYGSNTREILARRKQQQGHVASIRDILSQKAAESNVLNMRATNISPNVVHPQFSSAEYRYPPFPKNPPARSIDAGTYPSMTFLANGSEFSPNCRTMTYGYVPDINQYTNRRNNIYQTGLYTNTPTYSSYIRSLHDEEQPQSQFDLRHVTGTDSAARRVGGVRYSAADQENLEHAFF